MRKVDKYTPIRLSHLLGYAGVGSIVRASNDLLLVIPDIRCWKQTNLTTIPYSNRISKLIAMGKTLKQPSPVNNSCGAENIIPALIFPRWGHCKSCGLLHPNVDWNNSKSRRCECGYYLPIEQTTLVGIGSDGSLDDVPWHELAHKNQMGNKCRPLFDESYLKLTDISDGKYEIKCTRCHACRETRFNGFNITRLYKYQPWVNYAPLKTDENTKYLIVNIEDPRLYNPITEKSIVIPPESRRNSQITIKERLTNNNQEKLNLLNNIKQPFIRLREQKILADKWGCTIDEIDIAIKEIEDAENEPSSDLDFNEQLDILQEEYKALTSDICDYSEEYDDFITENKTQALLELVADHPELDYLNNLIKKVVAVTRLREILVFQSFSRNAGNENKTIPSDLTGETDWLPAVELWGEGVFIEFDTTILENWEKIEPIKKRADNISYKYDELGFDLKIDKVSPRFLLLHTLSHLIIRELEVSIGYPASSLSERIYSCTKSKMAGILIYTSVADKSGTLGGIVELSNPETMLNTLVNSIHKSLWCSLDPVCSEHDGQGLGNLNKAACHGCCLIPDTACSYNNVLLDRVFLKGLSKEGIPEFVEYLHGECHA